MALVIRVSIPVPVPVFGNPIPVPFLLLVTITLDGKILGLVLLHKLHRLVHARLGETLACAVEAVRRWFGVVRILAARYRVRHRGVA
jgi:hypothetical protein